MEILECRGTIDEIVRMRLGNKINRMSSVLEDPSLNVDPIPYDLTRYDESDDYGAGINYEDIADILNALRKGEAND